MNLKKLTAVGLAAVMALSLTACGSKTEEKTATTTSEGTSAAADTTEAADEKAADDSALKYTSIKVGETGLDLTTSIKVLNNRTDMLQDDYAGTSWNTYIEEFNKVYPNITVEIEGVTDYAQDSLLRLQGGDWGDIMMIPEVDKSDLSTYFLSYGALDDVSTQANYVSQWLYENQVYGIPSTAVGRGIVYNKKVFEAAGITELPKTPEDFMAALQTIKDKTEAIPLYTNYAAGWTMGAWDDYISGTATSDANYMNNVLLHTSNPFADPGDGTHAYNVYKILYDSVANGLTEEDFTTTDWEGSKAMINSGEVGCMVLGSWAYAQMQAAGPDGADIGYMAFPMTIDGKQYSSAAADYNFAINAVSDTEKQEAAMIFVKWMSEESNFSYNEGGLPIEAGDTNFPEVYQSFSDNDVIYVEDIPAAAGEEDLKNLLNADSELMVQSGGNEKIQAIVEHASNGDMTLDEIMNEWNVKWTSAQESNSVEVQ